MPQPFKGVRVQQTFRIPADLHRAVARRARLRHRSVNDVVVSVLRDEFTEAASTVGERQNVMLYDDNGDRIEGT